MDVNLAAFSTFMSTPGRISPVSLVHGQHDWTDEIFYALTQDGLSFDLANSMSICSNTQEYCGVCVDTTELCLEEMASCNGQTTMHQANRLCKDVQYGLGPLSTSDLESMIPSPSLSCTASLSPLSSQQTVTSPCGSLTDGSIPSPSGSTYAGTSHSQSNPTNSNSSEGSCISKSSLETLTHSSIGDSIENNTSSPVEPYSTEPTLNNATETHSKRKSGRKYSSSSTKRRKSCKTKLCPACGAELRKYAKCKTCTKSRRAPCQFDSGISSGEDVMQNTHAQRKRKRMKEIKNKDSNNNPSALEKSSAFNETLDNHEGCSSESKSNNEQVSQSDNFGQPRRSVRRRNTVDREYELRTSSLINRVEVERRKSTPKEPKPKSGPLPLSKYRRKTANARERDRMNEINEGFDELKRAIPDLPKGKLTKITTLRLALSYISALREVLGYKNDNTNEMHDQTNDGAQDTNKNISHSHSQQADVATSDLTSKTEAKLNDKQLHNVPSDIHTTSFKVNDNVPKHVDNFHSSGSVTGAIICDTFPTPEPPNAEVNDKPTRTCLSSNQINVTMTACSSTSQCSSTSPRSALPSFNELFSANKCLF